LRRGQHIKRRVCRVKRLFDSSTAVVEFSPEARVHRGSRLRETTPDPVDGDPGDPNRIRSPEFGRAARMAPEPARENAVQ
jgi:hypothetical protein